MKVTKGGGGTKGYLPENLMSDVCIKVVCPEDLWEEVILQDWVVTCSFPFSHLGA